MTKKIDKVFISARGLPKDVLEKYLETRAKDSKAEVEELYNEKYAVTLQKKLDPAQLGEIERLRGSVSLKSKNSQSPQSPTRGQRNNSVGSGPKSKPQDEDNNSRLARNQEQGGTTPGEAIGQEKRPAGGEGKLEDKTPKTHDLSKKTAKQDRGTEIMDAQQAQDTSGTTGNTQYR